MVFFEGYFNFMKVVFFRILEVILIVIGGERNLYNFDSLIIFICLFFNYRL